MISNQERRLAETVREIDRLSNRFYTEGFSCCPSCAFGDSYTSLCARAERQRIALAVNHVRAGNIEAARRVVFEIVPSAQPKWLRDRLAEGGVQQALANKSTEEA